MNFFDDYGDKRTKIPYDDVPITRNERVQRGFSGSGRGGMKISKFSSIAVSFMIIVNLVLSVVCLCLIKGIKTRTINNYSIEVGSSSEVSSVVKNSALSSSVCVSVGASSGSGVIYKIVRDAMDSNSGVIYFVTCYHVVRSNLRNVKVQLSSNSEKLSGIEVIGYSESKDLAVLKYETDDIEWALGGCTATTLFDSVYTSFGERVFAIGNSLSSGLSITDGLISQINAVVDIEGIESRCLQISAEINPGNSGGGLFNAKGELIGIVNAKRHNVSTDGEVFTVVGTSFAIPSSIVRGVADQIIAGNREVQKVSIGVEFSDAGSNTTEYIEYNGERRPINVHKVTISKVTTGVAYGKLRAGDVIQAIEFYENGSDVLKRVTMFNKWTFDDYALSIKPGSVIKFYIEGREDPIEIEANSSELVK